RTRPGDPPARSGAGATASQSRASRARPARRSRRRRAGRTRAWPVSPSTGRSPSPRTVPGVARIALDIDSTLHHYWDLLDEIAQRRFGVALPYDEQEDWGITKLEHDQLVAC